MIRWLNGWKVIALVAVVSGCAEPDESEETMVGVSFLAEYADIYGDITVEFEGSDATITVSGGEPTSCVDSNVPVGATYRAKSSRGFSWKGVVSRSQGGCETVALTAEEALEVFHAVVAHDPWGLPLVVSVGGEVVGTLVESWKPNPYYDLDELDCANFREYFLDAARQGKAVVVPVAEGQTSIEFWVGEMRHVVSYAGGECIGMS